MNIIQFLNKKGYDTVPSEHYRLVGIWESWYRSKVRGFHQYRINNGAKSVKCDRLSAGMAKMVSEDIADDLMNEKVKITLSESAAQEYVNKVLSANNWQIQSSAYQERKSYTGTVAYVPYINDALVDEDGNIIPGTGEVRINYFEASNIYPLSWLNGVVTECAFVCIHTQKGKKYAHVQIHAKEWETGEYMIENHVVECTKGAGTELDSEEWKKLAPFINMSERVYTGSDKRQFVIDRLNIVNNVDPDSPMGVAVFANAIDQLKGADIVYDSYVNEFILGKKRIFVAPEMLSLGDSGDPVFDPNDVTFYQLPEDSLKEGEAIREVNMEIRAEAHSKAINDFLNILSVKCGFGTQHYRFENGNIQTATQVISENSDLYKTIVKHEIILESALKELVEIIIRLGNVLGAGLDENVEITIDFDDSIIEDKATERKEDRQDVSMGAMSLIEYRQKWYNEDETTAKANVPQQAEVIE